MPVHDWTRLEPGDFHDFHQSWVGTVAAALNDGLPPGFMATVEHASPAPFPDAVVRPPRVGRAAPPSARVVQRCDSARYARLKDRVVIRRGRVVAVIEVVSPGNKDSRNALRAFVEKAADILNQGVNLLVVDLFPPTPRDPQGIHKAIWDEFTDDPFPFLPDRPLTVASYLADEYPAAYVETVGLGDPLPSLPIFLSDPDEDYVPAPLEATYQQAWAAFPDPLKELMTAPAEG